MRPLVRSTVRVTGNGSQMDSNERLLTIKEVADYLGVPVATLYQWRYRREGPPGFRIGGLVRYRRSDVDAWIEQQVEMSMPKTGRVRF